MSLCRRIENIKTLFCNLSPKSTVNHNPISTAMCLHIVWLISGEGGERENVKLLTKVSNIHLFYHQIHRKCQLQYLNPPQI